MQQRLKQLEKRLSKQLIKAQTELKQLSQQQFACEKDAQLAAERMNCKLPLHQLVDIKVVEILQHKGRGRPRKNAVIEKHYQLCATLAPKQTAIDVEVQRAGRFLLATNVLDASELSDDDVLIEYRDLN
ncbi:hypothetical protein [Dendronalium sp. ChiSLP03b]|uniref:hypothetical protein n=1 Tax=Dendronalium sp. ChiSLP03b TaxID=3075381 RepID=UPI002AD26F60|nr:hypothetical protein [Dendronalium sp. ChiSLP03b]MDZ8208302.1 hypothetical protein [Dendronalium sp. ChiSLP03b]